MTEPLNTEEVEQVRPEPRKPTLFLALLPILAMMVILAVGYIWLGLPAEPLLVAATFVAGFVAIHLGWNFDDMMAAISEKIAKVMPAFLILIAVGFLIGSWMVGGTIPMLIYYGLEIVSPEYLAVTALLVTSIVSVATGTSWAPPAPSASRSWAWRSASTPTSRWSPARSSRVPTSATRCRRCPTRRTWRR